MAGHRSQRTCLGCGERDDPQRLIRVIVAADGQLLLARQGQRGGYLHRREGCWSQFAKRKSHYRAFHVEVSRGAKEKLVQTLKDELGSQDGE